jgi:hypothetical protein
MTNGSANLNGILLVEDAAAPSLKRFYRALVP